MNQISLAIKLLLILKTQGIVKKQALAQQLEISEKNVQRLRNQLEMVGYTIETIKGRYGGYRLVNSSFFPVTELTYTELKALQDAYHSIITSDNPLINDHFKQAYSKIIGNYEQGHLNISIHNTQQLNMDYQELEKRIASFQQAIMNQNITTIHYQNNKIYEFEPYDIFQVDIAWYVIGYQRYKDVRTFRLDRINSLTINDKKFIKEESFNLNAHLSAQGFKIEKPIILKGKLFDTNYLKEFRISDHQIVDEENIEIKFYTLARAKRFILEQGSKLSIEHPESLKEFQRQEALKVLSQL